MSSSMFILWYYYNIILSNTNQSAVVCIVYHCIIDNRWLKFAMSDDDDLHCVVIDSGYNAYHGLR